MEEPPAADASTDSSATPRYFPGGPRFAFFVLLVALVVAAYATLRPVLLGPLFAAAVASLGFPLYRRLAKRLGGRRRLSSFVAVFALLAVVLVPLGSIAVLCAQRLTVEIAVVAPWIAEVSPRIEELARGHGAHGELLRRLATNLANAVSQAVPALARRAGSIAGLVGSLVIHFLITLFLFSISLYYFFVDGEAWRERLVGLLPIRHDYARAFLEHFRQVSLAVLVGSLGTAAMHGVLGGLGYWIFGVSAPLIWAVLTAAASFIPAIGTAVIWLPLAVYLGVTQSWVRGLLLVAYGVLVISLGDNIVRPLLTRFGLTMHQLMVFLAIFGGVESFGLIGLFLGPLLVALALSALDMYEADEG